MSFSLWAKIVYRAISPLNGEIIIKEQLGQYTLYVDGIPQSGGVVRDIWRKGVSALPQDWEVPVVLLLGVGGGTVINVLKKRWPLAKITGIEIDKQMITVAKAYFQLDQISGLRLICKDAQKVVSGGKGGLEKGRFDLILVDMYRGKDLPSFVTKEVFMKRIKALLSFGGVAVFNYLLDEKGRETVYDFEGNLKKFFPKIKLVQTLSNSLIFAYL
ncbi:spermidine synthase [Patescibacteria group bacterium]